VPQTFTQTGLFNDQTTAGVSNPQKCVSEIPWNISGVSDFLSIIFIISQTDEKKLGKLIG